MKILITGSTGLIGSALVDHFELWGDHVTRLVRRTPQSKNEITWQPDKKEIVPSQLEGFDVIIHLAGVNVAGKRWNEKQKEIIRNSRVEGTQLLCQTLAHLQHPPKLLISASAIGIYGHRGDEILTEDASSGDDFLSHVCQEWEEATAPAIEKGIRVVHLRTGVVLASAGGALAKMLLPFQCGAGGVIGSGKQFWSWVTLIDFVGIVQHLIDTESLSGPVNAVAPHPVTNKEFTKTLGKVLHRPTIFPMPAFVARILFGEMAESLLLASTNVQPQRLQESGYEFLYPKLKEGIRAALKKP
ncbi:Cell division inhibitor [hydrothermal vent metagenome]|uniref:Cell division inhibitor n=1 Tax=hydrothermal vent metagenome TaxID=652676 RepID=A0A3B1E8K1_9ZZZZ